METKKDAAIRVVVFDDNNHLRLSLEKLIDRSEGLMCVGAYANCEQMLQNLTEARPDVVLMDIEMPGTNGIEAVKIIKIHFPGTKVLMETIFDDDEKIFHSICNGAEGYILKNMHPLQIMNAIKEIYEGGAPMSPTIASKVLALFKAGTSLPDSSGLLDLTPRELDVLRCLVDGMSYKQVAAACFVSFDTVCSHVKSIYRKLHVNSKSEAVKKAIKGRVI